MFEPAKEVDLVIFEDNSSIGQRPTKTQLQNKIPVAMKVDTPIQVRKINYMSRTNLKR